MWLRIFRSACLTSSVSALCPLKRLDGSRRALRDQFRKRELVCCIHLPTATSYSPSEDELLLKADENSPACSVISLSLSSCRYFSRMHFQIVVGSMLVTVENITKVPVPSAFVVQAKGVIDIPCTCGRWYIPGSSYLIVDCGCIVKD